MSPPRVNWNVVIGWTVCAAISSAFWGSLAWGLLHLARRMVAPSK